MNQPIPSAVVISDSMTDQLYTTYDGGYVGPSNCGVSRDFISTPVNCEMGDKIPDHIIMGMNNLPKQIYVNEDVIGAPVIQNEWDTSGKAKKQIWQVSYTPPGQYNWTNAHVVASSMTEALALCARNGIPDNCIKTMHRLESSQVLC